MPQRVPALSLPIRYTSTMDDFDKQVRRSALKLVAIGVAMGLLIGFVIGLTVAHHSIERTVVVPLGQGIRT